MAKKSQGTVPIPPLEEHSMLDQILHHQAMAAVVLLLAAVSAFVLANVHVPVGGIAISAWYAWLWTMDLGIAIHKLAIDKPLHVWINDGLMSIFFFLVGLEIKRELLVGELASFRKALLPIAAAIGGMVCPALVFTAFNYGQDSIVGWGTPMATDIAFAAGVLGLLSRRVPSSLAVFLIALAIVDDLGSVIVIAVFYTDTIALRPLLAGLFLIAVSIVMGRLGVRNAVVYTAVFMLIWFEFLSSGVHATIAGVLFAFTIPADARYERFHFAHRVRELVRRFTEADDKVNPYLVNERQQQLVRAIEVECIHVEAPLQRIENKLHPFTAFLIMPLFAFANSGVPVDFAHIDEMLFQPVTLGVIFGLLIGKQIGIMGACALVVGLKLADLPKGVCWKQLYGVSWLAGIGFTMALFVGGLAFGGGHGHEAAAHAGDAAHAAASTLAEAKIGTLLASIVAGSVGTLILLMVTKPLPKPALAYHAGGDGAHED
jgi:NhaA family Na+:H+ antiporter